MNKKLVYHLFLYKDWRENKVYDIHFRCLAYYKDRFDEAYFAISLEDPSDIGTLNEIKHKLIDIFCDLKKIEFELVENSVFCECVAFKKQVIDRLGHDDLVFFAHSKGIMDIKEMNNDCVYRWICALYFLSLNYMSEVKNVFNNIQNQNSYGSLMIQFTHGHKLNSLYEWHYSGTFFWINSKRLKRYIKINNVQLPDMADRYYAENFLGNIYPMYLGESSNMGYSLATSHNQRFCYVSEINLPNIDEIIKYEIGGDINNFIEFVEKMTEKIIQIVNNLN